MKKVMLVVLVLASALWLYGQTKEGPFVGVITETMCGADHSMMGNNASEADCVVQCVKSNPSKYRYALRSGKDIYLLSDQQTPEKFAAQKVKVTGTLYEKTKVIDVKKIEATR